MAWQAEIPSLPQSITDLSDGNLRRRAETVWNAGHTLLSAIDGWEQMFRRRCDFVFERGNEIARAGRAAITTLGALRVRCDSIQASEDSPNSFYAVAWPVPPSDIVDVEWYTDQHNDEQVTTQLSVMMSVLMPDVAGMLAVLQQSPDAAFSDALVAAETPNKVEKDTPPKSGGRAATDDGLSVAAVIHSATDSPPADYHGPFVGTKALIGCLVRPPNYRDVDNDGTLRDSFTSAITLKSIWVRHSVIKGKFEAYFKENAAFDLAERDREVGEQIIAGLALKRRSAAVGGSTQ